MTDTAGITHHWLGLMGRAHRVFPGSVLWALIPQGISIDNGVPQGTPGDPITITRLWATYHASISKWSARYRVPHELILATIATESRGDPNAEREEPHLGTASVGLMQTLITTAHEMLPTLHVTREWLRNPDNSIQAGTAYIGWQAQTTYLDPPVVACAYNAGGVYHQAGEGNRWRMRQYPIGTGQHADRFVAWFNDAFRVFSTPVEAGGPRGSFCAMLRARSK